MLLSLFRVFVYDHFWLRRVAWFVVLPCAGAVQNLAQDSAMQSQKESRLFLQKLLQNPPALPFEPKLLPLLFAVTQEGSNASVRSVVALIEKSPRLATRVLAVANSAAYGLEFKVSSLQRAINIMGLREVRQLVLMVGMSSFIREARLPKAFDRGEFWRHLLSVAAIARTLANVLGGEAGVCGAGRGADERLVIVPDEAYLAGLMHDVGKIFLAATRPDIWERAVKMELAEDCGSFEAENAQWGMDHGLIGAAVLHHWKLPLSLTEPINLHHSPELATTYKMEARLLAAANALARCSQDASLLRGRVGMYLPESCDVDAVSTAVFESMSKTREAVFEELEA